MATCAYPTHLWTVPAGTDPEDGQKCKCGRAAWPWHPELPQIDLSGDPLPDEADAA